jgi:hypothetical protein
MCWQRSEPAAVLNADTELLESPSALLLIPDLLLVRRCCSFVCQQQALTLTVTSAADPS